VKPNPWFRASLTATLPAATEAARIKDAPSLVFICGGSESYRTAVHPAAVTVTVTRVPMGVNQIVQRQRWRHVSPCSVRPAQLPLARREPYDNHRDVGQAHDKKSLML